MKKQHIPMNVMVFSFDSTRLEPTNYYTRGEHANHHTTDSAKNLREIYEIV